MLFYGLSVDWQNVFSKNHVAMIEICSHNYKRLLVTFHFFVALSPENLLAIFRAQMKNGTGKKNFSQEC